MKVNKKSVLVVTSTYPRWKNDNVPTFVQQFSYQLSHTFKTYVLAPHYKGARRKEADQGVSVERFRYVYPEKYEDIVYNGGGVFKIKKTPSYAIKLLGFVVSELYNTSRLSVAKNVAVINAHWLVPQGFVAVLVKFITRKKVVVSVHGSDVWGLNGGIMKVFKRFVLRHADVVVANSSATLRACQDLNPAATVKLIPMGINQDDFKPASKSVKVVKKYGLNGTFTILFVGRLTKVKGAEYLMSALKRLKEDGRDFKALIVGEGPEEQVLKDYVRRYKLERHITFVGWIDKTEITNYYNTADVLVGPSLDEALGLVFVEAQSCGLPVIATNVGGIPDVIKNGETGFLIEKQSSKAIYEKLCVLHDSPKLLKKMALKAPQYVSSDFSWSSVEARYREVFESLV